MFGLIEQRERFEQEATERTEMDSVLCFLGYLLLNFEAATFRADVDFFSCVSRLSRFHSRHSAGANRAEPLGLALGFLVCSHQFSGRSAWTLGTGPWRDIYCVC